MEEGTCFSLGCDFGNEAMSFLKELGHLIGEKSSDLQSFHHLCQRLSMSIKKFNAEAVLSCSSNTNINKR